MKDYFTYPDTHDTYPGERVQIRFVEWSAIPGFQVWMRVDNGQKIAIPNHLVESVT